MFAVHEEDQSSHPVAKANTCMPMDVNRESGQEKVQSLGGSETEIHLKTSDEVFFARKLCSKETQTNPCMSMDISVRIKNRLLESENADLKSKLELSTSTFQETPSTPSSEPITCINVQCAFDFSELENDDKKSKIFTGLTYVQLLQLWSYLSPAIPYLKYWDRASTNKDNYNILPKNAFLMTFMRLRNGYTNQDLAYRFGTSLSNTSVIIISWIQFLYSQFLPLKEFVFAERSRIQETMPLCFKTDKNIRCIIDCTEFFSQRPRNFQRQGNLFSSYKSHTTYKILVAVAPNGSIMFVSEVFEGSISDRDIVIKSGFLDLLNPGDTIMADRGFNIKDLLNARKVDLIIPPFLMGRKHLTPQEEALTKDIAKHRIHVEMAIERMKKFKLLQKTIQLYLEPLMSQIVFIVGCLVNFQEPLVK
ncbi:uncharacterized protein LOC128557834 [Mercenaria mercenaria]|uniref:uncharacterized protein LOC128557834 n=1 Tax=Mercenaria mercenaria TaxID=6596 RepID=UPI00234F91AF|nr:uncharacterized protein LOC128557834 [Mercenaria mercenaria]